VSYSFEFVGKTGLKYLYIGLIFFFIYLGASTFLVYQKKNQFETSEKRITKEVGPLLKEQVELEKQITRLNDLRNIVEAYQPRAALLQTILKTAPRGSLIQRINISGHTLEIEGTAPDASKFIEVLAKRSDMVAPRFTSPLVREKKTGQERFKLIVEYTTPSRREGLNGNN